MQHAELAFPRPDISAAIEHIDDSRRDLLAPLTDYVAGMLPIGQAPTGIIARMIFRTVAPEVKVRLYRSTGIAFPRPTGHIVCSRGPLLLPEHSRVVACRPKRLRLRGR